MEQVYQYYFFFLAGNDIDTDGICYMRLDEASLAFVSYWLMFVKTVMLCCLVLAEIHVELGRISLFMQGAMSTLCITVCVCVCVCAEV